MSRPPDTAPRRRPARNRATGDRMASHGDDFASDDNASGEGNDASLIAGPAFTRDVPPAGDGTRSDRVAADAEGADEVSSRADSDTDPTATRAPRQ